jgi:hypothetical protein
MSVRVLCVPFLTALAVAAIGCSGTDVSVCGNGLLERGESCDCGRDPGDLPDGCYQVNGAENSGCSATCGLQQVLITQIVIRWSINGPSALGGGSFDNCTDVDAAFVNVHLAGPGGLIINQEVSCGQHQVTFMDQPLQAPLPGGEYTASLSLSNGAHTQLTAPVETTFPVAVRMTNQRDVDLPLDAFYDHDSFRGTLGYRLYWGALNHDCAMATPAVTESTVVLSQNGQPRPGYPLTGPCRDTSTFVPDLLPGMYQLRVEGRDDTATLAFCEVFDVKVGAGGQPADLLVVPSIDASPTCGQ